MRRAKHSDGAAAATHQEGIHGTGMVPAQELGVPNFTAAIGINFIESGLQLGAREGKAQFFRNSHELREGNVLGIIQVKEIEHLRKGSSCTQGPRVSTVRMEWGRPLLPYLFCPSLFLLCFG